MHNVDYVRCTVGAVVRATVMLVYTEAQKRLIIVLIVFVYVF